MLCLDCGSNDGGKWTDGSRRNRDSRHSLPSLTVSDLKIAGEKGFGKGWNGQQQDATRLRQQADNKQGGSHKEITILLQRRAYTAAQSRNCCKRQFHFREFLAFHFVNRPA
jgi:hypothetical protein